MQWYLLESSQDPLTLFIYNCYKVTRHDGLRNVLSFNVFVLFAHIKDVMHRAAILTRDATP